MSHHSVQFANMKYLTPKWSLSTAEARPRFMTGKLRFRMFLYHQGHLLQEFNLCLQWQHCLKGVIIISSSSFRIVILIRVKILTKRMTQQLKCWILWHQYFHTLSLVTRKILVMSWEVVALVGEGKRCWQINRWIEYHFFCFYALSCVLSSSESELAIELSLFVKKHCIGVSIRMGLIGLLYMYVIRLKNLCSLGTYLLVYNIWAGCIVVQNNLLSCGFDTGIELFRAPWRRHKTRCIICKEALA